VVADHGVQGQDAAVGQGEDGLVMAFALVSFALVVGPADGVGPELHGLGWFVFQGGVFRWDCGGGVVVSGH